jgi:hypothetical protein
MELSGQPPETVSSSVENPPEKSPEPPKIPLRVSRRKPLSRGRTVDPEFQTLYVRFMQKGLPAIARKLKKPHKKVSGGDIRLEALRLGADEKTCAALVMLATQTNNLTYIANTLGMDVAGLKEKLGGIMQKFIAGYPPAGEQ